MPSSKLPKKAVYDLGVTVKDKKVFLFHNLFGYKNAFRIATSTDGFSFKRFSKEPQILNERGEREITLKCRDFRISQAGSDFFLTYKIEKNRNKILSSATSKDLITWKKINYLPDIKEISMLVPDYKYNEDYVLYFGEDDIKIAFSKDLKNWEIKETVLSKREGHFDSGPLNLVSVFAQDDGILVIYFTKSKKEKNFVYYLGAALFDKNNPNQLLKRREQPLWELEDDRELFPLGAIEFDDKLIVYIGAAGKGVFALSFGSVSSFSSAPLLEKVDKNPILEPVLEHLWENQATFNPAAIYDEGKVHFIYRAVGSSDTSVLGYAASTDGINIDERLDDPAYIPREDFEVPAFSSPYPSAYMSGGGGYGGCEDPRLTKIDNRVYMTYVAHNGSNAPRVALTSISVDDFKNKRWNWDKAKIISAPDVVDKNACLLPEKIKGKYVIFHRIFPNILIDMVDDLNFENDYLKGEYYIGPRKNFWDSRKVGAGAPPLKTDEGWLLIYHAVDDRDASKYKMGAMLLDLDDPTKVNFRSSTPILEPREWYENEGFKAGVAYPCGSVIFKDDLVVYYGGADKVVCAAKKNLNDFITGLKHSSNIQMDQTVGFKRLMRDYD
ncbi:MAG: hypothetical protein HYT08_03825 [Candidatus Levybacteria bacterium]|nr:hypothetical protein [Candidatus Levybacteria bacterium]